MKVFKMNDCDWIASPSKLEAIKWYERYTGFDWIDDKTDINPIECDMDELITYNPDIYNYPDYRIETTFRELIESYKKEWHLVEGNSFIILSTEY